MNPLKPIKILFFIAGVRPTEQDIADAAELKAHVVFRNASAVPKEGAAEDCAGVAGAVPELYEKLPKAQEAIAAHAEKLKKAADIAKGVAKAATEKKDAVAAKAADKTTTLNPALTPAGTAPAPTPPGAKPAGWTANK